MVSWAMRAASTSAAGERRRSESYPPRRGRSAARWMTQPGAGRAEQAADGLVRDACGLNVARRERRPSRSYPPRRVRSGGEVDDAGAWRAEQA